MSSAFDRDAVLSGLEPTRAALPKAYALGQELAPAIDRVCLVACGSANRAMLGIQYWLERYSPGIEVRRYFPAEFMAIDPPRLNERTLVLLASKSGTTPETVAARIRKALPHIDPARVIVAPDCGMKYLPREVADGKMRAMVEGAAIVRRELAGAAS